MRSSDFPNPELAFEDAKRAGRSYDLDTASIDGAIQAYRESGLSDEDACLFINVLPSTLINPNFDVMIAFPFNYIKLDRLFSTQLHLSGKKKALIQLFRDYCEAQKVQLGVANAQGDFLGRPAAIEEAHVFL